MQFFELHGVSPYQKAVAHLWLIRMRWLTRLTLAGVNGWSLCRSMHIHVFADPHADRRDPRHVRIWLSGFSRRATRTGGLGASPGSAGANAGHDQNGEEKSAAIAFDFCRQFSLFS